ncbi:MAG TPA: acyl-CoA thioester hydrolase/BAAT C-terminal domain-containing protein [Acidimicrobiales bacterium]
MALSGSGGGVPSWWGDLLAPHGVAVLAAAYFGVDPLPAALCEIPVETVVAAGEWLRRRPEVRSGRVGVVGGSKGAELALLAATTYPDLFGPVAAIAPSCVAWFGVDLIGGVADASARSSWTLGGRPGPFVPPVSGVGFERTERGLRSVGIYAAALKQADTVAAATITVELGAGPLVLLSGGQDAACPSTSMARAIVDRMTANGRSFDVRHVDFPECGTS